jgi:hypothetical protein
MRKSKYSTYEPLIALADTMNKEFLCEGIQHQFLGMYPFVIHL